VTGFEKSLAVVPLGCAVPLTLTYAQVVVKVATRAVTSVPKGTVRAISVPLIVPVTSLERAGLSAAEKLKAVISLSLGHL